MQVRHTARWWPALACFALLLAPGLLAAADAWDGGWHSAFTAMPISVASDGDGAAATADAADHGHDDGGVWHATTSFFADTAVDTAHMLTAPLRWDGRDWLIAGACVGTVFAVGTIWDDDVRRDAQEDRGPRSDLVARYANQMGTVWSLAALASAGIAGWAMDDERGGHAVRDGLETTVIASLVITPLLKFTFGRSRPNKDTGGVDDFTPFSGAASFPSGHTTQAFAIASVLASNYREAWWVGGTSYAVAGLVGFARINDNKHYLSDVVAGAMIGTAVGWEVASLNRLRRQGVEIHPLASPDVAGVSVTWRF